MLNATRKAISLALLVFAAQSAVASTYDFSYLFAATNTKVVGHFDGTTAGDYVVGISNITAAYDGRALAGPLYAYGYNSGGWVAGVPPVSFSMGNNAFAFVNCPHFACAGDPTGPAYNFFVLRPSGANHASVYFASTGGFAASDTSPSGTWTLTERVAAVPEPASYALFAGGLMALGFLRLRNRLAASNTAAG